MYVLSKELIVIFKELNKAYECYSFVEGIGINIANFIFEKIQKKQLVLKTEKGIEVVEYDYLCSDNVFFRFYVLNDLIQCDLEVFEPYETYWFKGSQYIKNPNSRVLRFKTSFSLDTSILEIVKDVLLKEYKLHLEELYQQHLLEQENAKKQAWINIKNKEILLNYE